MRRRLVAVLAGGFLALAACNALSGADDLGFGAEADGVGIGARSDGAIGDGSTGNGGEGGTTGDDGGATVTPSLASCGAEQICLPDSNGWSPAVSLLFVAGSSCPAEWPDRKDSTKAGGGSCQCTCTSKASACTGPLQARSGSPTCAGMPAALPFAADGGCWVTNTALPSPVALTGSGPLAAECSGSVVDALDEPQPTTICAGAVGTTSASCDPGEVCVPKPKAQFPLPAGALCMVHDGEVSCPSKLPLRTVMGTSVNDARSCAATCGCAPTDCNGGTLEAFATESCTQRVRSYDVKGSCSSASAPNVLSYRYTPGSGCKVTQPPQVQGSMTVESPRTLCCAFPF